MNTYEYQKLRGLERKIYFINKMGGKCSVCGYHENISALEFHHRDPKDKEFRIDVRHMSNRKMEDLETEISKCDLVCANCHRVIHHPNQKMSTIIDLVNRSVKQTSIKKRKKTYRYCECGNRLAYSSKGKRCKECSYKARRIYDRPTIDQLKVDLEELKSFYRVGKKYNTTHSTIQKWMGLKK